MTDATTNIEEQQLGFFDLLDQWNDASSIGSEDILAAMLPLMLQVYGAHNEGKVAPVFSPNKLHADHGHLWFQNADLENPATTQAVTRLKNRDQKRSVKVVEHLSVVSDDDGTKVSDKSVSDEAEDTPTPRYLTGYRSWEVEAGHHDPLTDIYGLGMIMASLATGLDFREREPLEIFTRHRTDLTRLNTRLHPVMARAIERMTSLHRYDRAQDLGALIKALENHRSIGSDFEADLSLNVAEEKDPQKELMKRLRARLYDLTRRNRLVYHKPTAGELNLTETSVPLVINIDAIKEKDLFTAKADVMRKLIAGKEVTLGSYLRFEEMLFAPSVLAKIRSDAARDQREFGGSPLRLVPVFLRWYDLKNAPEAPISSPLLLMRVELKRRKGVRDGFTLRLENTIATINPALSFVLEKLYGIRLPPEVDLAEDNALQNLHANLEKQIMATEPGVKLEYADRPKMRLLHQKVRRRLDQFNRRRQTVSRGRRTLKGMKYSYDRPGFEPLGIQLFREFVSLAEAPRRELTGRPLPRRFNQHNMVANTAELEGNVLQKVDDTTGRYDWSFDLCNVTLANFNYRKMTLVRDYDALISGEMVPNEAFDLLFSNDPRPADSVPSLPKPEKRYPVIEMDPTQESSVLRARTGQSYVIQGPPGTGKSQTISNLIADFIGQGKRVLFVCEKRAALDVVYNRLRGIGLSTMCALVHDSQENKRDFIKELERIYNHWSETPPEKSEDDIETLRRTEMTRIETALADVALLVDTMRGPAIGSDTALADVLRRALSVEAPALTDAQRLHLPDLATWTKYADTVRRAAAGLKRISGDEVLARRPERLVGPALWKTDDLTTTLPDLLQRIAPRTGQLTAAADAAFTTDAPLTLGSLIAQIQLAARVSPAAEVGQLGVFGDDTPQRKSYRGEVRALGEVERQFDEAREKTSAWTDRLSPSETETALSLAEQKEGSFLSFLSGDWRRLKALVSSRTDVTGLAIEPSITSLLRDLKAEHEAAKAVDTRAREIALKFGFDDHAELTDLLVEFESGGTREGLAADPLRAAIRAADPQAEANITTLARLSSLAEALLSEIDGKLVGLETVPVNSADAALTDLATNAPALRDLQPLMQPLASAPTSLWSSLTVLDLAPDRIDAATLHEAVRRSLLQVPGLANVDPDMLAATRKTIAESRVALQTLNAQLLETRAITRFREHVALTNTMDRDLDFADRDRKSNLNKARRALEHEFGKTRAYRSPREMLAGPAGALLPDLKPIWLMSPLSVADVLPLGTDLFDVVIFDEASQIPVEDAVPTLVRAPQVIVVGDDKQLPPTNFFGSGKADDDFDGEDDDDLDFELSQDSFLALSAEKLSATMLGWHYRSRSEELIGFSNEAFYSGRLLTIPSHRCLPEGEPLNVTDPATLPEPAANVLRRPVSFHYLQDGTYSERRNAGEATYIAHFLRDLLAQKTGKSVGIVAFSEAQQGEIDSALNRLADEDEEFADLLDTERDREDDGTFNGLFVKNLENVQGDERDIIILSICYGPDRAGKMRMNFGPINKLGGEKRLNVIFSRAKENMVVVSSIKGDRISNDYNAGANALKTFLHYAEAVSTGNDTAAVRALSSVSNRIGGGKHKEANVVTEAMADRIKARGWEVRQNLGLSDFVVDLAIRKPGAEDYQLAILIDRAADGSVKEAFTTRSTLLEVFGWQVITLPLKDWWADPDAVLDRIDAAMTT
ncbi:AAA domain-containing protein [Yoonia sp. BS5-3]|uniref:AAA domain-containing protein n=1 Tax=Yoonia phaeophyticola TaxID=3137369 RepID=A0ABZ3IEP5_9RHOB